MRHAPFAILIPRLLALWLFSNSKLAAHQHIIPNVSSTISHNANREHSDRVWPWWGGSGLRRDPAERQRRPRGPPWRWCAAQCTDLCWWRSAERRAAAAEPRCPRCPALPRCAGPSAAPDNVDTHTHLMTRKQVDRPWTKDTKIEL